MASRMRAERAGGLGDMRECDGLREIGRVTDSRDLANGQERK